MIFKDDDDDDGEEEYDRIYNIFSAVVEDLAIIAVAAHDNEKSSVTIMFFTREMGMIGKHFSILSRNS